MLRSKLLAASLAGGLAFSGAYALSAQAAPTPTPKPSAASTPDQNLPISKDRIGAKRAGGEAGISDMTSDKPSYAAGENYTLTVEVTTNTDGAYVVNYSKVTGATCQGSGSTTVTFSGLNGKPASKTTSFTCTINRFPVNGTVTLQTPKGVEELGGPVDYTIGGSLPGTPPPTKKPTKKPTEKPSTGGLANTGV
ncbi:hypothetical protein [Enemella evansiae]|uniref:hypothetical protein n=1 Tax=Enemella evansiae TaxID=2016499 RepID=UPI000B96245F|nr:hypothetical protein [Enemella evansiae]OYO18838.1 hypothetical protein BI335_06285 [Enemella evansiae]TDO87560.1 hypothetical protein C8D81_3297 [Enemella evansiae]